MDRLLVRDRDDREQRGDGERDRDREVQRGGAGQHQDEEDLLRRVGDGGQRVGRKHGECDPLAQALMTRLGERHRRADENALQERDSHADSARTRMSLKSSPRSQASGVDAPRRVNFYEILTLPLGLLTLS